MNSLITTRARGVCPGRKRGSNMQRELNKKKFNELNIQICRTEQYEFMLAMNKNVCNKFVTFGECNSCEKHDVCEYINKYTLCEVIAKAHLSNL